MRVFISHSNERLAGQVAQALKQAGLEVWDAERETFPGDNWYEKTAQALRDSEAMVVLLTPDALRSTQVRREIEYASGKEVFKHRLVPVLIGSPETFPTEQLPGYFRYLNPIYLSEQNQAEANFKQITQALQAAA